jgi:phosphatidylinositol-4,5-bisphosphate 4-phosphatase
MSNVSLGNGDSVTFNFVNGNTGKGRVEATLRFKDKEGGDQELTIKMTVRDRENLVKTMGGFTCINKTTAMKELANNEILSGPEVKKALQGLLKFYKYGSKSTKKTDILRTLNQNQIVAGNSQNQTSATVQGTAASQRIETLCGPKKLREVFERRDQNIFSKTNATHYGAIMQATLDQAKGENSSTYPSALYTLDKTIEDGLKNLPDPPAKKDFLNCISNIKKATIAALDQLSTKKEKKPLEEGKKLFKKYYPQALNNNAVGWKTFQQTVPLITERGTAAQFASTLKPANQMGCFSYLGDNGKPSGVSSTDRNTPHAMNLWETQVTSPDGQPLFQAIRHGCTRGQESASEEILTACLAQKFGMEELTSRKQERRGTQNNPFPLQLANMQLMTPGGALGIGTDKSLPQKQMEAFRELASREQPIKLIIPTPNGREIFVKLKSPLLFNFGVNLQQFSAATRATLVKDISKKNTQSMETLLGRNIIENASIKPENFDPRNINLNHEKDVFPDDSLVGEFLRSDASDEQKKIVVQLAHQIADIWRSDQYQTNATEPYAIQSRIALLTYQLGLSTTFNCKSGKDRTGIANIEINHLATETAMNGGIVPVPYQSLDGRARLNLNTMLNEGGANHITRACNGLCGLKIVDSFLGIQFSGVKDRMGDVQGASSLSNG